MKAFLRAAPGAIALAVLVSACAPRATQRGSSDSSLITQEDLAKYPGEPIERVIERKVPGVVAVRTASGGLMLQVRGQNSVDVDRVHPPLYVVNDMEYATGSDGAIGINPFEIASIKVLKGPETAIYGIRGANGVIVIKTKQAQAPKN
jgi:TonB-dependent starch-binding outer membrane protein SusC